MNQSLAHVTGKQAEYLDAARKNAGLIASGLEKISPILDRLGYETCVFCPSPCCVTADIYLDFPDLLFFHLMGFPVPDRQLRVSARNTCRHLGPKGCIKSRLYRPFTCTWYLCPAQKSRLRNRAPETDGYLGKTMDEIKKARKNMEKAFIRAVF